VTRCEPELAAHPRQRWDRNAAAWPSAVRDGGIESRRADAAIAAAVCKVSPSERDLQPLLPALATLRGPQGTLLVHAVRQQPRRTAAAGNGARGPMPPSGPALGHRCPGTTRGRRAGGARPPVRVCAPGACTACAIPSAAGRCR
jgi:hypothetical protein